MKILAQSVHHLLLVCSYPDDIIGCINNPAHLNSNNTFVK